MRFILLISIYAIFISCHHRGDKHSADHTTSKVVLNRPAYSLEYLSNWTIDSSSKAFDIDGYFILHSPVESGLITFFIFDIPKNEEERLNDHINLHLEEDMKNGRVSYFRKWGNYLGRGAIIRGKMGGIWKSEIKIFVHSSASNSFLITSVYADGYKDDVLPGLNQIESSFKLK